MVAVLDYGIGNILSIVNMFKKIGVPVTTANTIEQVTAASKLVLPGIGAFDHCMKEFNKSGLREAVESRIFNEGIPLIGVCVGCQMLMEKSEEGGQPGLCWIKGKVVKFKRELLPDSLKVPHMGWSDVTPLEGSVLYDGIEQPRYYFVHSYHVETDDSRNITGTAEYGYKFVASVATGKIHGVQFHPEKSHRFGMQLYLNFAKL